MKVGDLVRRKRFKNQKIHKIGVIWAIGSPNPIARVLWSDGQQGAMHPKFLEVVNESR